VFDEDAGVAAAAAAVHSSNVVELTWQTSTSPYNCSGPACAARPQNELLRTVRARWRTGAAAIADVRRPLLECGTCASRLPQLASRITARASSSLAKPGLWMPTRAQDTRHSTRLSSCVGSCSSGGHAGRRRGGRETKATDCRNSWIAWIVLATRGHAGGGAGALGSR
jgi:hypothetical protein